MKALKLHKIYKDNFPLKSEEAKDEFIKNNKETILNLIDDSILRYKCMEDATVLGYMNSLKSSNSLNMQSRLKIREHNNKVMNDMKSDKGIMYANDKMACIQKLKQALICNLEITIEEANAILAEFNHGFIQLGNFVFDFISIAALAIIIRIIFM